MNINILDLRKEMQRRKTKQTGLLGHLQKYGSITTAELWRFGGTGASSRLHELRAHYKISPAIYVEPGLYKYVYKGVRRSQKLDKAAKRYEKKIMSYEEL